MCLQHLFSLKTLLGVIPEHESVTPYYYWLQLIIFFVCLFHSEKKLKIHQDQGSS